jgi:hypothetical protein
MHREQRIKRVNRILEAVLLDKYLFGSRCRIGIWYFDNYRAGRATGFQQGKLPRKELLGIPAFPNEPI